MNDQRPADPGHERIGVPPSHVDLLAVAGTLRRAVVAEDPAGVHRELSRLRTDLLHHLHAERSQLAALPGATPVVAHDGQQRLLQLLDNLPLTVSHDATECPCLVRSAEIEVALHRQVRLEDALLRHRAAILPDRPSRPDNRASSE